jgi:phage tail-like protein
MAKPTISERTRGQADPIRNFKYQVSITMDGPIQQQIADMGFTSVDGLSMSTEVMAYREGGWNTNFHKLPGQTDFSPLTLSSGVFMHKPGMWNLAKQLFSVQWGNGTLGMGDEFRFDMQIRVLDHPVTRDSASGVRNSPDGTVLTFNVYNAFVSSVGFGALNASDNGILVHSMQVQHEGFDVIFALAP